MLAVLASTTPCVAMGYVTQNAENACRFLAVLLHSPATCTSIDGDTSKYKGVTRPFDRDITPPCPSRARAAEMVCGWHVRE
jgi:hypothetical protein